MGKIIGILGGASDVATANAYARINALSNARLGGWHMVETLIAGMDFGVIERGVRAGDWDGLAAYTGRHLDHLAPADIVICISNTLHPVVAPAMAGRDPSFLHIYDPTADAARAAGVNRLALFGTAATMGIGYAVEYYRDHHGLEIVVPTEPEQAEIDRIIFDELCRNRVTDTARRIYVDTYHRMARDHGANGLILGCTEIGLLIGGGDLPGVPLFDTLELLCVAAVDAALAP